jgi:hypothetical protein
MMKKIQLFIEMAIVVSAVSVVGVPPAFAVEEVALWTANSREVTAALNTTATGLLNISDLGAPGGAVTVDCEGTLDGYIEANGLGYTSEVLYLGKKEIENLIECEVVKGKEGLCETSMLADVIPIGLPWETTLSLASAKATEYVNDTVSVSGGSIGYMLICLTILGETLDECTQTRTEQEMAAVTGGVEGISDESGVGTCTLGGKNETDFEGSTLITINDGELLGLKMP